MQNNTPPAEPGEIQTQAPVPALRFCGQLAQWTGNSADRQGEVGISSCIFFEALPGEMASSCLELHNQGSTAIFYSWQRLDGSTSISRLLPPRKQVCFYFNQSSAVILPGETRQMDLMFKSGTPGLHTESWRLKTHPSLLRGASVQVTLMGLALHQDRTAALRRLLEVRLEETVTENFCRSLLYRMLEGIQTPERPRTLAEFLLESPPSESSGEQESETLDLDDRSLLFRSLGIVEYE
ncbi:unnamed protein product [Tetraodon nigroviridis]|uniref:(spotted green pufferfish) hypothetical protein n=1 Tax=Tetraodon nigroviridis TaxID=99883 RepID=Q4SDJ2_TETNG|nr:unnamed protein product [Tetraodon nigroviridis]